MRLMLILAALCTAISGCNPAFNAAEEDPLLSRHGTEMYRVVQSTERGIETSEFAGLATHIGHDRLISMGNGFSADAGGNLIRYETFDNHGRLAIRSVSQTPTGATVIALSGGSRPAVVTRALGIHRGGIWYFDEAPDSRVTACIEEFTADGNMARLLECLGFNSSRESGSDVLDRLSEWSEPDCSRSSNVTQRQPRPPRLGDSHRFYGEVYKLLANSSPAGSTTQQLAIEAASRADEAARILDELEDAITGRSPVGVIRGLSEAAARAERLLNEAEQKLIDHLNRTPEPIPHIGGNVAPAEDPRCEGREVDADRGSLFSNAHFCPDHDFVGCMRRQQDALAGMTDLQCYREEGPSGAPIIVCKPRVDPIRPPDEDIDGGDLGQPPDLSDPNAPLNSAGEIQLRYVDTTPLGAILLGLCSQGGCPDFDWR